MFMPVGWSSFLGGAQAQAAAFTCDSVDFDGTNDWMYNTGLGLSNGKEGTFSCWVRLDGGNAAHMKILQFDKETTLFNTLDISRNASNKFEVYARDDAETNVLRCVSTSTYTSGATWLHLLISWRLASSFHMYVNDVEDGSAPSVYTDATIDYTVPKYLVGVSNYDAPTNKLNGCLAELFFHTAYLDISSESNRRKFISATGKPVNLGADGSTPFGVQPALYLSAADGGAATDFATNLGSGGSFTITGSLDIGSTSPSD